MGMSVMDRLLRSDMVVVEVVIEGVGGGNVGVHEIGVRLSPGRDKARDQTQAKHLLSRLLKTRITTLLSQGLVLLVLTLD